MITDAAEYRSTPVPHRTRRRALIAILAIVVLELIAGIWIFLARNPPAPQIDLPGLTVFSPPERLPKFDLVDHHGRPFANDRLRGHWTLAAFGYTSCPDFCPTTLAEMARLFKQPALSPEVAQAARFVFISVDPFRDTTEQLAAYVTYFNPDFLGLTGEPDRLQRLNHELDIPYGYAGPETGEPIRDVLHKPVLDAYVVDHYSGLLFIDPQGRLVATLLPPFDLARTLRIYEQLRDHH
ncbi:MAG: SCO family protein [Hahellaceae bacterium]|nr:SCO family protein [Hahellaceae bacterium]